MNPLLKISILLTICCGFVSCQKEISEPTEPPRLPVLYFLTPEQKALISNFPGNTLHFINQDGSIIEFVSDGIRFQDWYYEVEARRGEEMILYYTCQGTYIPTFKIGYQLWALEDSTSLLNFCNISGDLYQSNPAFYSASSFQLLFDPKSPDSIFSHYRDYSFEILDSVNLKTGTYYDVYYLKTPGTFGNGPLTNYWYFTRQLGIIAFENVDGNLWCLKQD